MTQENIRTSGPGPGAASPAPGTEPTSAEPQRVIVVGVETGDQGEPREPAEAPKFTPPEDNAGSGRFAAYDTTLGRFVGGVVDSRSKASKSDAAKAAASVEIVEV